MALNTFTIREAHDALVAKKCSSVELTQECLDRITSVDGDIQAFLTVLGERALVQAAHVDKKIAHGGDLGILEGIPCALKDNMMVQGERTTAGSKILDAYHASYSATVVDLLEKEGSVLLGKTNMDEYAMGSSTENSGYWVTRNPWDTTRVPGGSSGGSAAALAADECIFSLGSDTGGSIRQPASLCGVTGLKPTYGSVSRYGLIAMASSLDQIGPFGKTVEDASIIFDAIKGSDTRDSSSAQAPSRATRTHSALHTSIEGMKIGVPKEYFIDGIDDAVALNVGNALKDLERLGAILVDISLPHTQYALSTYYVIMPAEVSANLARFDGIRYGYSSPDALTLSDVYTQSRTKGLGREVRRRIMLGSYVLASGYYDAYYKQAQKVRELVRRDFDTALLDVDCIVCPTSPIPAFPIGEKASDPLAMYLADIFTVSANIAGVPALSVPCGFAAKDGKDLPVGLQILGKHFDEETILRVGHQYQQATDWHLRKSMMY
ncbi:MAG: Asp-tRNA(Asn)/Glu-tRNA(Gln) amidotransferase subunit GatA [Patescibacteria group bacterium]